MARQKQKREPSDWLTEYVARASDVLGFLVAEYEFFPPPGPDPVGYAVYLDFVRPAVAVSLDLEIGYLPWIWVKYLSGEEWVRHSLDSLSRRPLISYYPDLNSGWMKPTSPGYIEAVSRRLVIHAHLLRTYGEPFLRGDTSQLEGVRPGQFTTASVDPDRPRESKKK